MLRILGRPTSINVRKVLWTAAEIGLEFEHQAQWATPQAPAASPEFLRLNPNGLVPVVEDGSGVLWESNTICRYLARKHGRTDLLPAEPAAQARVEMWMDWQATELNGAWRYAFLALGRRDPAYTDPDEIAAGARRWHAAMGILDGQLAATGAFAAGERFTLADVVVGLSVHRWRATPMDRPRFTAVEAYAARLAAETRFSEFARAETP